MVGLCFPFLLIISATMYAFKTRKCPGGFNETRFILFTNSINTIHWLAFVPLYLVSTDHKLRAVILAFSLSLSGIVQLGCLIFPKLYTVLFKPEKNTKGAVMTQHRSQSYMAPSTPPNSVASLHPGRLHAHRNSTPAVILKMELSDMAVGRADSTRTLDQEAEGDGGVRMRHLTWSHYRNNVDSVTGCGSGRLVVVGSNCWLRHMTRANWESLFFWLLQQPVWVISLKSLGDM